MDATIAKMHEYVMRVDPEAKPRVVEVCINGMLRAIKLKHELAGNIEDPAQQLLAIFNVAEEE